MYEPLIAWGEPSSMARSISSDPVSVSHHISEMVELVAERQRLG
jgi:hypothetical protein